MQGWRCVLILSLCLSSLLAQTFQYSRGWTNGRKRSTQGNICARIRHQKFIAYAIGRVMPEILAECGIWLSPDVGEAVEDYGALMRSGSEPSNHDGVPSDLAVSSA